MKKIKLTQRQLALVDDEDFEFLNQWRWCARKRSCGTYYAFHTFPDKINIAMHRMVTKAPKGMEVDHKDRNGLNNQKSNLRICTKSQNMMNKIKLKGSASKYLGVYWMKSKKKWYSKITVNGRVTSLGYSKNEEEMALRYNEAAMKYYGEFARLNEINHPSISCLREAE